MSNGLLHNTKKEDLCRSSPIGMVYGVPITTTGETWEFDYFCNLTHIKNGNEQVLKNTLPSRHSDCCCAEPPLPLVYHKRKLTTFLEVNTSPTLLLHRQAIQNLR